MVGEGKKQITAFFTRDDMAKSLGQIHTLNFIAPCPAPGATDVQLLDLSAAACDQLQTMVRQGQYYKVVGIDMDVVDLSGNLAQGSVSGEFRYFAPTRGRCEAYKHAYRAVRKAMDLQGINVRGNKNYDFRVPIGPFSRYSNSAAFLNAATIDGTNELCLSGSAAANDDVFGQYNANIQPQQGSVNFSSGFGLPGGHSTTDFVLQQGEIFDPSQTRKAAQSLESIPFQLAFDAEKTSFDMQWRPDPALFLAVLAGQFEIHIDQVDDSGGAGLTLNIAIHVSGWKSIMGNPDKKRRKSKRRSKKKS